MKKSIIAAGAASAVLAAMPVVGVFAADSDLTQTDIVKVTIDSACSLATSGASLSPASTYTASIANGAFRDDIAGSTFTITCNDTNGWFLTAVGAQTGGAVNRMDSSTNKDADDIASTTTQTYATDAATSDWGFKMTAGTEGHAGATITSPYSGFSQVPAEEKTVATGTTTSAGTTQVSATYAVQISQTQAAGTYTGMITYRLGHPATSAPTTPTTGD